MLMEQKNKGKRRTSPAALEAERRRRERQAQEMVRREKSDRPVHKTSAHPPAEPKIKQPPKERTSRAAQAASRKRKERKEDTRLEGLRQKQTKEAKQRTRHRIGPVFWRRLFIILLVSAAIMLVLTMFFRVKHIDVEGNRYYSSADIIEICGVAEGDNLLTISRGEIAGNIFANCEYVSTVQVSHVLPNRVTIRLTEYPAGYGVKDERGDYYLISSDGTVLKQIEEKAMRGHILIRDLEIRMPLIGDPAVISGEEGDDTTAQFRALTTFLKELEAAELIRQVTAVSVSPGGQLRLNYEDRFEVTLGTATSLAYKLEHLKVVMAEQKEYATGTVDLSYEGGKQALVNLD